MTKEKAKEPQIRFKGFTNAWEQRKLGEVFTERSERSGEGELISVTINSGVVKASELDRKDNSSDNKSNYKKVKVGDIAYNSMRMWQGASGYSLYDGILSPAYTVIIPRKNVESKFFAYDFKRHEMIQTFKRNSQGLTSDTWNLKFPTLKTVKVMVPSFNEQRKISAFFERLDYLITLHQRKCDLLSKAKKTLLQKMFPKNGKTTPEIRFKGFTGAWEQRKLGEYLEVSPKKNKEETYDKTDVLSVSGDVGIVNQIEFQGRSFAGVSVANYGVVENEDVVYTKSPLKANPYGIIKTNKGKAGIVSTLYAVYKPRDITDPKFVQVYFEQDTRMNNYMRPLVNKGAKNDMKVSNENALKGLVIFPKLEEQRQISTYFESFDHLITLHQHELEKLQNIKKSCLKMMFV
ncbi:restriction endonuclease subunit S [Eubacterium callanderi]|uniref:restriction endonuclease subunit S n=1 Tax=Eubacterium callanderi TaxID=53442 RepID=UPI00391B8A6E